MTEKFHFRPYTDKGEIVGEAKFPPPSVRPKGRRGSGKRKRRREGGKEERKKRKGKREGKRRKERKRERKKEEREEKNKKGEKYIRIDFERGSKT